MSDIEGISLGVEDFRAANVNEVAASADSWNLVALQMALAGAAREAAAGSNRQTTRVFELLTEAIFLNFEPQNRSLPFATSEWRPHGGTPVLDIFSEPDISFFADIAGEIEAPLLRSRIADLVWVKRRSVGPGMALQALDAYRAVPLASEFWFQAGKKCFSRAVDLAIMLRGGAGDRLDELQSELLGAFQSADTSGAFFACSLGEFILDKGLAPDHYDVLTSHLDNLARDFEAQQNYYAVRGYCEAAKKCYEKQRNKLESAKMAVRIAEAWVKEAESRMEGEQRSFMVAASHLENAVNTYFGIPKREREALGVTERIPELRRLMEDMNRRAPEEMQRFSTRVDIEDMIERAELAVRGKSLNEALHEFANIYAPPRLAKLREKAVENMRLSVMSSICIQKMHTDDGRLVAVCPAMEFAPTDEEFNQKNADLIRAKLIERYRQLIHLAVVGYILPALDVLHQEHVPQEADFISLAQESPLVPPGRAVLFGKGLYAGYVRDFTSAIHLLVPQVENMVRFHMKTAGEVTTVHDPTSGVSQEIGLSSLMERPVVEQIFGPDGAFEISALFCESFGANLRNEVAHGLITQYALQSTDVVYAWWLCLSNAVNAFWNRAATEARVTAALVREAEAAASAVASPSDGEAAADTGVDAPIAPVSPDS